MYLGAWINVNLSVGPSIIFSAVDHGLQLCAPTWILCEIYSVELIHACPQENVLRYFPIDKMLSADHPDLILWPARLKNITLELRDALIVTDRINVRHGPFWETDLLLVRLGHHVNIDQRAFLNVIHTAGLLLHRVPGVQIVLLLELEIMALFYKCVLWILLSPLFFVDPFWDKLVAIHYCFQGVSVGRLLILSSSLHDKVHLWVRPDGADIMPSVFLWASPDFLFSEELWVFLKDGVPLVRHLHVRHILRFCGDVILLWINCDLLVVFIVIIYLLILSDVCVKLWLKNIFSEAVFCVLVWVVVLGVCGWVNCGVKSIARCCRWK